MTADGPKTGEIDPFSARRSLEGIELRRDRSIARLAERQHGVVTLDQLCAVGLSGSAVRKRVEAGRLHRVHQRVYAVGHPLLNADGRWMAAVLTCGSSAVLSHRSAAALWGLLPTDHHRVDVTAPNRRGRIPVGIRAHKDGSLRDLDRTCVRRIPCTSVARTLLDLAAVVASWQLRKAIGEAEVLRLFDLDALQEVLDRSRGRRGVARLRLLVSEHDPRIALTRSDLERRFLALCERAALQPPQVNVLLDLGGQQVEADFLWRDQRLIVEADGRAFHDTTSAFERDRRRDQQLQVHGWRVIRCTWRQVVDEPADLARTIRTLLAADIRRRA